MATVIATKCHSFREHLYLFYYLPSCLTCLGRMIILGSWVTALHFAAVSLVLEVNVWYELRTGEVMEYCREQKFGRLAEESKFGTNSLLKLYQVPAPGRARGRKKVKPKKQDSSEQILFNMTFRFTILNEFQPVHTSQ